MMSTDKVARLIAELHGLPIAKAERIAMAAAHRRRAATGCCDLSHDGRTAPAPAIDEAWRIPRDALARQICASSAIPLGEAISIASRVVARVSLMPNLPVT